MVNDDLKDLKAKKELFRIEQNTAIYNLQLHDLQLVYKSGIDYLGEELICKHAERNQFFFVRKISKKIICEKNFENQILVIFLIYPLEWEDGVEPYYQYQPV